MLLTGESFQTRHQTYVGVGLLWVFVWSCTIYDTPDAHPTISAAERAYITSSIAAQNAGRRTALVASTQHVQDDVTEERPLLFKDPETRESSEQSSHAPVPWLALAKSRPMWAIIVMHFCNNWMFYSLLTRCGSVGLAVL